MKVKDFDFRVWKDDKYHHIVKEYLEDDDKIPYFILKMKESDIIRRKPK